MSKQPSGTSDLQAIRRKRDMRRKTIPALAQAGPVSIWMILFVTLPMLFIIYISFMSRGVFGDVVYQFSLESYQTLLDAEAKLADLQAADAVEKLIDAIGTVTLDSEETIKAARDAYDALTEEQKAQVGNYQTLLDAEAKLAQLKKDAEKPSQPEQPAKPSEDANKPATGDAGVALWLTVMCMTSLLGAALVGKKRKA